MNRTEVHFESLPAFTVLQQRLRELGLLLVCCTNDGELRDQENRGSDWLADLLLGSPLFARALRDAAAHWSQQAQPAIIEPMPGCRLAAMPITERRRRTGYTVTVLLSERFLASEQLLAMCQHARMDLQVSCAMLRRLPLTAENDIGRLASMVRLLHADQVRLASDSVAMESVGQQLAESYEEINLLYTIIGSMTVVERPDRFVKMACEELLATLPFAWVGAQFSDDAGPAGATATAAGRGVDAAAGVHAADGSTRLSDFHHLHKQKLAGRLIVAGAPAHPEGAMHTAARQVLAGAKVNEPIVLEPARLEAHAPFAPLGVTAAVQPVCRGDVVIGVLIAGDRHGPDPAISSADMKILSATATHMSIFLENSALYDDLNAMFLGTLEALTASIDAKDRYTCGHSMRVAWLSHQLASAVGLGDRAIERVHIAGLVHDVGKIGVPESVLCKPGRLTDDEFAWIRQHPEIGYRILKDIPQLQDVLPGVLHHHERWDGGGYPHGLKEQDIPQFARVIALADSFDAMSSNRHYRSALSRSQVLAEIRRCSGSQFDPQLADVFVSLDFSEYDRLVSQHSEKDVLGVTAKSMVGSRGKATRPFEKPKSRGRGKRSLPMDQERGKAA